jgi:dTMP kinase
MGGMPATEPTPTQTIRPARGTFLALDGPDGCGKTTQAARLADWLRARGREVVTCRDPAGTALGERLRAILLDRDRDRDRGAVQPSPRAEMLLFMAGRAQLVDEVIRPALGAGKTVVSDRFLLANLVYQGYAGGLPVEEIGRVGRASTGGLLPDLTLLLDVPTEVARARVGGSRDRIEDRPEDYHRQVRIGFLRAAEKVRAGDCPEYPAPIVVVDASAEPDAVFDRICSEVERALALGPRP